MLVLFLQFYRMVAINKFETQCLSAQTLIKSTLPTATTVLVYPNSQTMIRMHKTLMTIAIMMVTTYVHEHQRALLIY